MQIISRMARRLVLGSAIVAMSAGAAFADSETHWRLFIGDHSEPVVRAVEVEDGAEAGAFLIESYASLYRSQSGRGVFAVQGEAGKVAVIDSGIALGDHGDHVDLDVEDAKILEATLEGTKPAHFVENDGRIALFYDGEGKVEIFPESQALENKLEPVVLDVGAPHHGLAITLGDYVVHSVPNAEDPSQRPVALRVVDRDGNQIGDDVACPGLHGQASSARVLAFGCHDGVVIGTADREKGVELRHVETGHLGEGNVSTLKPGTALQFFLTNYGQRAVLLIEPGAEVQFRKIDLPTRRVDFAVDPANARNAYIFTEDGQLHLLDVLSGEITKSVRLTDPYSMDGHWRDPRPRLAVAGDHIAVTDPQKGLVRLVDIDSFEEDRTIAVKGVPYTIVAVGGSGQSHD